ncbi:hypothetical protein KKE45_01745 [Patescibacteria group bacterium]|nr:hypothetical protein [Patescibacteria group bacterium]
MPGTNFENFNVKAVEVLGGPEPLVQRGYGHVTIMTDEGIDRYTFDAEARGAGHIFPGAKVKVEVVVKSSERLPEGMSRRLIITATDKTAVFHVTNTPRGLRTVKLP